MTLTHNHCDRSNKADSIERLLGLLQYGYWLSGTVIQALEKSFHDMTILAHNCVVYAISYIAYERSPH